MISCRCVKGPFGPVMRYTAAADLFDADLLRRARRLLQNNKTSAVRARFIAFEVSQDEERVTVDFKISGYASLEAYLATLESEARFKDLVAQIASFITSGTVPSLKNVAWDCTKVFVNVKNGSLGFILIPFKNIEADFLLLSDFLEKVGRLASFPGSSHSKLRLDYCSFFSTEESRVFSRMLGFLQAFAAKEVADVSAENYLPESLGGRPVRRVPSTAPDQTVVVPAASFMDGFPASDGGTTVLSEGTNIGASNQACYEQPSQGFAESVPLGTTVLGMESFFDDGSEPVATPNTTVIEETPDSPLAVSHPSTDLGTTVIGQDTEPKPLQVISREELANSSRQHKPLQTALESGAPSTSACVEQVPAFESNIRLEPEQRNTPESASVFTESAVDNDIDRSQSIFFDSVEPMPQSAAAAVVPQHDLRDACGLYLLRKSTGEKIRVKGERFVVGKSKYSDYQIIGNNTVSRSHVFLDLKPNGTLWLEDNASKNGTSVDGVYLDAHAPVCLKEGQVVRMSDEVFEVRCNN